MLNHLICFFLIRKLNMKQEIWNFSLFKPTRVLFFTVVSFHEHFNFRRSLIAQMITFWQWCQRGVMCLLIFWHIFASDRCIFSQPAQIVKERQKKYISDLSDASCLMKCYEKLPCYIRLTFPGLDLTGADPTNSIRFAAR